MDRCDLILLPLLSLFLSLSLFPPPFILPISLSLHMTHFPSSPFNTISFPSFPIISLSRQFFLSPLNLFLSIPLFLLPNSFSLILSLLLTILLTYPSSFSLLQVISACVRMTTPLFSNRTLPRRRSRSHQQTPPLSQHNQGSNPNLTHSPVLDRNQISPVEQLSDGHSKSPKLSTKTPLTKVSNLESLCEETTGDVFDSEAERVRVCPGMVGGEEHVFQ